MSKMVFFNVPAAGHNNPTIPVVEELIKRGHDVWYYSFDMVKEDIEETGATYISCDDYMPVSSSDIGEMLVNDVASLVEMAVDTTLNMKEKVYKELSEIQPDCIVYDSLCIWGQMYARDFGIPVVCSTSTFAMNQQSVQSMKPTLAEGIQVLSGLPRMHEKMKKLAANGFEVGSIKHLFKLIENDNDTETVVYTSREFQPESDTFSDKVTFVGPSFQMPELKQRNKEQPLIYISLGSMLNDKEEFYQACIDALKEEDCKVVMAVGSETDLDRFGELPEQIEMHPKVDQVSVLRETDVFITHSGMNSINESLYFSVPSVLYPLHSEEEMVANQVIERGAGKRLEKIDPAAIRDTVLEVLNHDWYRNNAGQIAHTLQRSGGAPIAADKIEKICWQSA